MTLPAAANLISLTLDRLKEALANSSWFRTWCGAASVAAARERIVLEYRQAADLPSRPYVVLGLETAALRKVGVGTHGPMSATVTLAAEHDVGGSYSDTAEEANLDAQNEFGELIAGLHDWQVDVSGIRVEVNDIEIIAPPAFPDPRELESDSSPFPYWFAACRMYLGG